MLTRVSNTTTKPIEPNSSGSVLTKWQCKASTQTHGANAHLQTHKCAHPHTHTCVTDPFSNGSQKPGQEVLWSFMGIDLQ